MLNSTTQSKCNDCFTCASDTREPYRTITLSLLRFYPILFVFIGTVGNSLSVYVVLRSKLRRHSTFIYLAFLSIVDLIVLYTFCVNFILHAWFNIDLQQVSLIACKIFSFSIYFFPQTSAWILTAVSVDRVFALTRGIRKRNKRRATYVILGTIFLVLFLINVQFFFYNNTYKYAYLSHNISTTQMIYRIVDTDMDINVVQCSSEHNEAFVQFYQNIWVIIDAIVNVYLPFTLMFLCSTIIFLNVLRTMNNANNSNKRLVAKNLSTMLLSVNTMFVLLTGPIVLYLMFEKRILSTESYLCNMKTRAKHKMIKLLLIILMNANHTGNILVYCLTGTEFRTQLLYVIGKKKKFQKGNSSKQQTLTLNKESVSQTSSRKLYYNATAPRLRAPRLGESVDDDQPMAHLCLSRDDKRAIALKSRQQTQSTAVNF